MSGPVIVRVPIPTAVALTANQRLHWQPKRQRVATIRRLAAFAARRQARGVRLAAAHCLAIVWFRDTRKRDALNWADTVKPCIDGIVTDAGLLPGDDTTHLTGPDIRVGHDPKLRPRHIAITFEFTPASLP